MDNTSRTHLYMHFDFPYRHELQTVSDERMEALIAASRRDGARAYETVEDSLERIRTTKLAHISRAKAWGSHPDERVPMAMLDAHRDRKVLGRSASSRAQAASKRAVADGALWHPLLDRLVCMGLYSSDDSARYRSYGYGEKKPDPIERRVDALGQWARGASEDDLLEMLRFEADIVHVTVAKHTSVLSEAIVDRLFERPAAVARLAGNPTLTDELQERIAYWAVERLPDLSSTVSGPVVSWRNSPRNGPQESIDAVKTLIGRGYVLPGDLVSELMALAKGERDDQAWKSYDWATDCLLALGEDFTLDQMLEIEQSEKGGFRKIEDVILKRAEDDPRVRRIVALNTTNGWTETRMLRAGSWEDPVVTAHILAGRNLDALAALGELAAGTDLGEQAFSRVLELYEEGIVNREYKRWQALMDSAHGTDHLLRIYALASDNNDRVFAVIRHPKANAEVWRHIARNNSRPNVREALAEHPEARHDPEVRDILLSSNARGVLFHLAKDGFGDEVPDLLERLVERDAKGAFAIMRELDAAVLKGTDPTILAEVLTTGDRSERTEAMTLLGKLRAANPDERAPSDGSPGRSR